MTKVFYWAIRIVPAVIFFQSLFFKFTGAPEAIHIFSELGVEPYGRIGLGVVELIAGILLLLPKTARYGALLGVGLMIGALMSHFTVLGIEVNGDGGTLFILGVVTLLCCSGFLFFRKSLSSTN